MITLELTVEELEIIARAMNYFGEYAYHDICIEIGVDKEIDELYEIFESTQLKVDSLL